MKTTSVGVSETLLQEARKVMKQDEPVRVVEHALSELVRIAELKRGIQTLKDTNDVFWPHYLEELRPNSWSAYEKRRAVPTGDTRAEGLANQRRGRGG